MIEQHVCVCACLCGTMCVANKKRAEFWRIKKQKIVNAETNSYGAINDKYYLHITVCSHIK